MHNLHTVEVQVHMPVNDGYRVKVSVIDLGMYINGVLVFPPNEKHDDWVVYPPSTSFGPKRFYPIEFDKKSTFWKEIVQGCIQAVELDQSYAQPPVKPDFADGLDIATMTDEEFDKRLKKSLDEASDGR